MRPAFAAHLLLFTIVAFFVAFVVWAHSVQLDEVTRGNGRVVPSTSVKVIQNLEGGIIREILVKDGTLVAENQVLVRLDQTRFQAEYNQTRQRAWHLRSKIARLMAESETKVPDFPADVMEQAPAVVSSEMDLFRARRDDLDAELSVLRTQLRQREQQIDEARAQVINAGKQVEMTGRELSIVGTMVARGLHPQMEQLRSERAKMDAEATFQMAKLAVDRFESALKEVRLEIDAARQKFRARAVEELAVARIEYNEIAQQLPTLQDRLSRTEVRSPVNGIVNRVLVTTLGGVIQPGASLVEIVPREDTLLIEAQVQPSDIAFLHPGLSARVKITAYDFAVYGALDGRLEHISPDAIKNPEGPAMYLVQVRTTQNALVSDRGELPIIPGMIAEVDILTGKKTIADYLLQPVLKVTGNAFRER